MEFKNEIRIIFNKEMVEKYRKEYFKKYPSRKKFDLKPTAMSLNEFTAKTRMVQAGYKVKYAEFVQFVLEQLDIPKLNLEQCHLTVNFKWKDMRRRDYDNYCITLKFYMDQIVKYGLIADDNFHVIDGVDLRMEVDKTLDEHIVEFVFTY